MKILTIPSRNMFGKLSGQYESALKREDQTLVSDTGKSREEAVANLASKLELQERHGHTRIYRWAKDGTLFTLYWAHSWGYDIIKKGSTSASSCFLSTLSQTEAMATMERHVEQYGE